MGFFNVFELKRSTLTVSFVSLCDVAVGSCFGDARAAALAEHYLMH